MRKIALISTHCDTEEKIEILQSNINLLKSIGVDSFVISTFKIDVECDFYFQTKENPILYWPERAINAWRTLILDEKHIKLVTSLSDYGWASLYQIKKVMELASTYDYDIFYFLIYDLKIDEKIIEDISTNKINLIYPRKDYDTDKIYPSSLHFAIFDKKKLNIMSSLITKDSYLKIGEGFAENFIHNCVQAMGMNHSEHIVSDLIRIVDVSTVFNYSKNSNYSFFFNKENTNLKIILFNHNNKEIRIFINDKEFFINEPHMLIETDINCYSIDSFSIECDDEKIDYLEIFYKQKNNIITIL